MWASIRSLKILHMFFFPLRNRNHSVFGQWSNIYLYLINQPLCIFSPVNWWLPNLHIASPCMSTTMASSKKFHIILTSIACCNETGLVAGDGICITCNTSHLTNQEATIVCHQVASNNSWWFEWSAWIACFALQDRRLTGIDELKQSRGLNKIKQTLNAIHNKITFMGGEILIALHWKGGRTGQC